PAFIGLQLSPAFSLLNMKAPGPQQGKPNVYSVLGLCGLIARPLTTNPPGKFGTALQLAPPSVVLNSPAVAVPAYTVAGFCGSITSEFTTIPPGRFGSPAFTAFQLAPPSVVLNSPAPDAPAYNVPGLAGSIAR